MSNIHDLTQAMLADRGNDSIRLALAQAYEEDGDTDRADFIRVQLELADLDCIHQFCAGLGGGGCPECSPLRKTESGIRNRVMDGSGQSDWFPGWGDWGLTTDPSTFHIVWSMNGFDIRKVGLVQRGFIRRIRCTWDFFSTNHESMFWDPRQTALCDNCGGDGEFTRQNGDPPYGPCDICGGKFASGPFLGPDDGGWDAGTGRVPRKPSVWRKCRHCNGVGGVTPHGLMWKTCSHCGGRRQFEHNVITTAQPLEQVAITGLRPANVALRDSTAMHMENPLGGLHVFTEKVCAKCRGSGMVEGDIDADDLGCDGDSLIPLRPCEDCAIRAWESADWPGVEFRFTQF